VQQDAAYSAEPETTDTSLSAAFDCQQCASLEFLISVEGCGSNNIDICIHH